MVDGIVLGALPGHAGTLQLVFPSQGHVPAVGSQRAIVVVLGTRAQDLERVRDIALCDLLAGRPVGEDGYVVTKCPAGATGGVIGALTKTPVVTVGTHLGRETNIKYTDTRAKKPCEAFLSYDKTKTASLPVLTVAEDCAVLYTYPGVVQIAHGFDGLNTPQVLPLS